MKNNIIALQVRYANGKASAVTYLTVHPVSLSLTGTITTSPTISIKLMVNRLSLFLPILGSVLFVKFFVIIIE